MPNFLCITKLEPTKDFFGCLPVRIGVFFCALLQGGFITFDMYEHISLFKGYILYKNNLLINEWITFSAQIVIALIILIHGIVAHKGVGYIFYFIALGACCGIAAVSVLKVITLSSILMLPLDPIMLCIHIMRHLFEFFAYFYSAYIVYSFNETIGTPNSNDRLIDSSNNRK